MGRLIKYLIFLWMVCAGIKGGYAQGGAVLPELTWEGKTAGQTEILLCNLEGKRFDIDVSVDTHVGSFVDGSYELTYGGTTKTGLHLSDFPLRIEYTTAGSYTVTFSAKTAGGTVLTTTYKVKAVKRPEINLKPASTDIQCLGSEVYYLVDVYEANKEGTKYTLAYDDGSAPDVMTYEELRATGGKFKHIYNRSYCHEDHPGSSDNHFEVRLIVENQCGAAYSTEMTYTEKVAEPIHASFTFGHLDAGYACTFSPVDLSNTTTGGADVDCTQNRIRWEWDFGNGKKSYLEEPQLSYEEAKAAGYQIKLIATNDYECASDTAYEHLVVVDRVVAGFGVDKDTLCSGGVAVFSNLSTGGGRVRYWWTVTPVLGGIEADAEFVDSDASSLNPKILFKHHGVYRVQLSVNNGCSASAKDTLITVKEDPEVSIFFDRFDHALDSLCPLVVGEDLKIDMRDFAAFSWQGNTPGLQWTITPVDGVTYEPGYGPTTEFPRFSLKPGKTYDIKVELNAARVDGTECGDPLKRKAAQRLKVNNPVIQIDITTNPTLDAEGVIRVCFGESVVFTNHSTGENLRHGWSIRPMEGKKYDSKWSERNKINDPKAADQTIVFGGYGDYQVTDTLTAWPCHSEIKTFHVRVGKAPTITYFDLGQDSLVCSGAIVSAESMQGKIVYAWYNNEQEVTWECSAGVEIADKHAVYPAVKFTNPGIYTIKASLDERLCPDASTRSEWERTVRVRSSNLDCELLIDKNDWCEREQVMVTNSATDIEGGEYLKYSWIVEKNGVVVETRENSPEPFLRQPDLTYGDYTVTGKVTGYCSTKEEQVSFVVHKNPEVVLVSRALCPGEVVLAADTTYHWWNNTPQVTWTIQRQDGTDLPGDYVMAADALSQSYPKIDFRRPGKYQVKATLPHAGCPMVDPVSEAEIWVYDPQIYGEITLKNPEAGQPLVADICENSLVEFQNTMTEEAGGLNWEWTIESSVAGGYQYMEGGVPVEESVGRISKEPVIQFLKYGEYKVKVVTRSTCNPLQSKEFQVTVRGIPDITFLEKMARVCAGDGNPVDMAGYVSYNDLKNSIVRPEWSILPGSGFDWVAGYGADTEYPRIQFRDHAHYVIKLTAYSKCAVGGKQELSSEIDVISGDLKSIFSVGLDSVGCVDDPAPYEILLNNASQGDSLEYTWTILPETGREWIAGDHTSESPKLRISQEGNYAIKLHITNGCSTDDSTFQVKAFARPTFTIEDIAGECEVFHFAAKDRVQVDVHNDALRHGVWTITPEPGYVSEGYHLLNGTSLNSFYPDIDFNTCDYRVEVEYRNRCLTPARHSFRVSVDKFIPIQPLDDDAICELAGARELNALPAGGYWTLKEPTGADDGNILYQREGKYYFNPAFSAYEEKDVKLVYNFRNLSCVAHDTINMHIWPLPFVEAGDPLEMCLNHEPVLLTGKDSVNHQVWQTNRGHWTMEGAILDQHYFKAVSPGAFRLLYEYTDGNSCRNIDSTWMTVHDLPATGFRVEEKNCIYQPVLFTPVSAENNTFEWVFGDNTLGYSDNTITHEYDDYGFREVICRAENQYHCRDTSAPVRIEIVNLPPQAFFDVDTLGGCAPFEVEIEVDRSVYRDDHNYLSFHWKYGEGTETDTLGPIVPKFYPSGAWDTTYVTTFTVSNMCGTSSHDTTITVYSVPKVSFALMHDWECSPVFLELQNTTTGNSCVFDWTFINKRTSETIFHSNVRNPEYEFTTDSIATTFYIRLKAVNQCNEDEFTDSLVVKPRSISAHFTPLEHPYACVNQEIFFRNNSSDTVATILNTYWNFGDGERTSDWSPRHKYDQEGLYTVSLQIDNGCGWDTVSSPVTIYPLPHLGIKSEDYLCEADTFTFVAQSDQELEYIKWKFGDGNIAYKDSLRHLYEGYGKFEVMLKGVSAEINQCADSVTKEVIVYNKPIMTILPLDTVQCSPLLYAPQVTGDALLMWDYGDGSVLTSAQEHWYENLTDEVQKFKVKVYAETDKGCKSEYEGNVEVKHNPRAILSKEVEKGNPQKVTFFNLSEEYTDCIWELPFKGIVHSPGQQVVKFADNGTYTITLIAENYVKCRDTAVLEHEVLIKGLYFPNTFIPHSLNGKISHFNGIGMGLLRYKLEVFDQYNNKIWETRALQDGKPSEGWDGANQKGERMPQGIYIWRAEAIFGDDEVWTGKNNESGVPETTQGTVLLLRE